MSASETRITIGGVEFTVHEHPAVPSDQPHVLGAVCRRTRIPSFIARTLTGGARWSHIGCVDWERGEIIEALVGPGVVKTPASDWVRRYPSHELVRTPCPNPYAALAYWRQRAAERRPYDWRGALGVPFRAPFQDPHADYCSELYEHGLYAGGRRRLRLGDRGVSPMESWLWL